MDLLGSIKRIFLERNREQEWEWLEPGVALLSPLQQSLLLSALEEQRLVGQHEGYMKYLKEKKPVPA